METNPYVNVAKLFDAIVADIKEQFPDLVNVQFFPDDPEDRVQLPVPACLLDVSEMEVDMEEDPGTQQVAARFSFSAFLVISGLQDGNTKLAIRLLAASLVSFLRLRHWRDPDDPSKCLPTDPAIPIGAYRDDFDPRLDRYEVWRVDWEQIVYLGESVWAGGAFLPTGIWLGQSPEIGAAHVDKYERIDNGQ